MLVPWGLELKLYTAALTRCTLHLGLLCFTVIRATLLHWKYTSTLKLHLYTSTASGYCYLCWDYGDWNWDCTRQRWQDVHFIWGYYALWGVELHRYTPNTPIHSSYTSIADWDCTQQCRQDVLFIWGYYAAQWLNLHCYTAPTPVHSSYTSTFIQDKK